MKQTYRDSEQSKQAGITYHLVIQREWDAQKNDEYYTPGAYEADGFIHCTNGLDLLTTIANMFYKDSADERTILVLDINKIESELRYEDDAQQFPHIYGPLNTSAVVGELTVVRSEDGTFTQLG